MPECPNCGQASSGDDAYCRSCGAELQANSAAAPEVPESIVIATFGPTTAWVGKTIRYQDEQFVLEGQGPIEAAAVHDYDRQGHLIWAYEGLREWVDELAARPKMQAAPDVAAVPADVERQARQQAQSVAADAASPTPSEPASGARRPWVLPVVMLVLFVFLTLLATALQGGYLRNGLGVGFTVCAIVLVGLLIWSLIRPAALLPYAPRSAAGVGRGVATLLVSCAVCLGLAAILWWVPHYEVVVPTDKRVLWTRRRSTRSRSGIADCSRGPSPPPTAWPERTSRRSNSPCPPARPRT